MEVSALANAIAQGKSNEQLVLLSCVFTQLGDCLATIATVQESNSDTTDVNEEI